MPPHSLLQLVPNRVAAAVERLRAGIWTRARTLTVAATEPTSSHLGWREGSTRSRQRVVPEETWGRLYDQRWCCVELDGIERPKSGTVYLEWRDQGEATAYVEGVPYYGFDVAHRYCECPPGLKEIWVESVCVQTGIWHPEATGLTSRGSLFEGAFLASRDDSVWHAYHDLKCLFDLMLAKRPSGNRLEPIGRQPSLERASPFYRRLLRVLDEAVDALDRDGPEALRRRLVQAYAEFRDSNPLVRAALTGHAHIDLVWLWPERVGDAKTVHTFATADRLMQTYPEFRFAHSQAASYAAVARRSPELLERVKQRIASGQWEATGVLYVESDTQLPCGEALARGFTLGQSAFTELRGAPANVVWLPDAFGYSSCLPQLMQLSGASFFFTNKVSWSAINPFPVSSFTWRGADGSEVLAHVLQDVGYNGTVLPEDLRRAAAAHVQSDVHPEFLYPTGYGDGGGGATEEMCERARRLASLRGLPAVGWDTPESFFMRLARRRAQLPVYSGELYLEFHRGTYTTHSHVKAAFRALERALQVREAVAVATAREVDLTHAWRRMLCAQFHDYIPGSSIPDVYAEGVPELQQLAAALLGEAQLALEAESAREAQCLFNPLPLPYRGVCDGALVQLPALSGLTFAGARLPDPTPVTVAHDLLSNEWVMARIDPSGLLTELVVEGVSLALEPGAGSLVLYPDRAAGFESWDIDRQALDLGVTVETPVAITIERDPENLRAALCCRRRVGRSSTVSQRYVLESGSRVLRIELELDWHEPEALLKLHVKTAYRGSRVLCGAPFGSIQRPQQPGPLAAEAMWEVPASRWLAGTDEGGGCGMFVVTEAKYGFSCRNGDWGLSLLRSPRMTGFEAHRGAYPAGLSRLHCESPHSDLGPHLISLALGRYDPAGPREHHPAWLADALFTKPIAYVGRPIAPPVPVLSGGNTLVPCWAKPLGSPDWVLRLHEVAGVRGALELGLPGGWMAQKVDLSERPRAAPVTDGRVEFKPYEIVSLRLSRCAAGSAAARTPRQSTWHGFYREDFTVDGRGAILVRPAAALPSRPWIWRTEFFGAFDSVDRALLQAGFHLAYIDVQNMYGSPGSLDHMDRFYACVTQQCGLGLRPVLEGFSRGGLFAVNWAVRNPRALSCLYLDAPVCDFKSWPGGRGRAAGSAQDWRQLLAAYGLTEAQALAYTGNPIDNLAPLARARVPVIAVYGEADVDLPPAENILLLRDRYVALGGEIVLLPKPDVGHHPHSLPDPTPILDFILSRA